MESPTPPRNTPHQSTIDKSPNLLYFAGRTEWGLMDTLIAFLVDKFGWVALVGGFILYLLVEMTLDVAGDIISEAIRDGMDKRAGRTPR